MLLPLVNGESRETAVLGRIWTVPPTRERKGPNPKPEIRGPKEGRNPKPEMLERGFGLRYSAFFRVSAFGIRIWAAGSGWYCPNTPFHHPTEALLKQNSYPAHNN